MSSFETDRRRLDDEFDSVLEDVYPDELRSYVGRELSSASMTPAILCLLSARAAGEEPDVGDAAGIQFVHAGLDATRRVLDGSGSWEEAGVEPVEEDMVLLAADVLVTVGFDHLLDHYEDATRVVNRFGSGMARERDSDTVEEGFEHELETFVETYTTAVGIGSDGEPPEEILSLARGLAMADCLEATDREGDIERASALADEVEYGDDIGDDGYVEALREASAAGHEHVDIGAEAQD